MQADKGYGRTALITITVLIVILIIFDLCIGYTMNLSYNWCIAIIYFVILIGWGYFACLTLRDTEGMKTSSVAIISFLFVVVIGFTAALHYTSSTNLFSEKVQEEEGISGVSLP